MNEQNQEVFRLLCRLYSAHQTKGIQPSELSDAIFDKPYLGFEASKQGDRIQYDIHFLDDDEDGLPPIKHTMRYIYDLEGYLLRVDQQVGSNGYTVQWERGARIKEILVSLASFGHKIVADDVLNLPRNQVLAMFKE